MPITSFLKQQQQQSPMEAGEEMAIAEGLGEGIWECSGQKRIWALSHQQFGFAALSQNVRAKKVWKRLPKKKNKK